MMQKGQFRQRRRMDGQRRVRDAGETNDLSARRRRSAPRNSPPRGAASSQPAVTINAGGKPAWPHRSQRRSVGMETLTRLRQVLLVPAGAGRRGQIGTQARAVAQTRHARIEQRSDQRLRSDRRAVAVARDQRQAGGEVAAGIVAGDASRWCGSPPKRSMWSTVDNAAQCASSGAAGRAAAAPAHNRRPAPMPGSARR